MVDLRALEVRSAGAASIVHIEMAITVMDIVDTVLVMADTSADIIEGMTMIRIGTTS